MTYLPFLDVGFRDNPTIDAFGRGRFSSPFTVFDSKQIADKQALYWDESLGASVTSTFNTNQASTTITVPAGAARTGIRQTKRRFSYQPGKSQMILMTGILGSGGTGITRRIGYFDDNNGLYFELSGTTLSVVRRTKTSGSVVNNSVAQTNWNIDKMDGTGVSGITLDTSLPQIFIVDFEWLGVGRVRFGFVVNGRIYYCHEMLNANNALVTTVYMSTPNLPLRYEISNSGAGGSASLIHICSTVISEGGIEETGPTFSADRGSTAYSTGNNTNLHPVLSIRLKSGYEFATVKPIGMSVIETGVNNLFRFGIVMNPTVAGADAASWTSITNSAIEYNVSRTNSNTLSGGTILHSEYSIGKVYTAPELLTNLLIGSTISGTMDQLVVFVQSLSGSESIYASLTWREIQ